MRKRANIHGSTALALMGLLVLASCGKELSSMTGWDYNNPDNGGYQVDLYMGQETGPGLILVQGGTLMMGRVEQDVLYDWNNIPRRVTVSSFYMDETEVANVHYREYLHWVRRVYALDYPEVYKRALPDTLVWRSKLAYNEPYVELYLRHPAYQWYPVVGVNWIQATEFCKWRTDRVNEYILIREGLLDVNPNQTADDNFNTDAYLAGQYEGLVIVDLPDLDPNKDTRKVKIEDGIFLPRYRLPTEAEWEFAALGLIGNTYFERVTERRIYPWNGHYVRNDQPKELGRMMANYKRGRGDNMGVAGQLNDNADITSPVFSYWPNNYGLYNMAGNVSEWVMDVYRPLTIEDADDFRSYRGNTFQTQIRDEEGIIAEKDSLGQIMWRDVTEEENLDRRNYKEADNISYLDGDKTSSIRYIEDIIEPEDMKKIMYETGGQLPTTLVNDLAHVYKGASWKDRAYWMGPGTRRYLDQDQETPYLGFRCAMVRVGSPVGF
ncbi:MAG: SUMF1/EgtB/PvdO family nonheme iron enzyme [Flavobacteriales bacterium]|nr:SUMF1/EgtB/PvdO family nonheme iron enzyme [Flavobacteriales bacterium]